MTIGTAQERELIERLLAKNHPNGKEAADALQSRIAEVGRLTALLTRIEPHLDAIVCYASTMGEHEPNQIAFDVRAALSLHRRPT